ncbi:hypothetical protein C6499_22860 [Candidatus Poribacteria bacterium]|nr:MAG: hypothetical protein C6499_22860 [Candidatus Poribacteria bacterium]
MRTRVFKNNKTVFIYAMFAFLVTAPAFGATEIESGTQSGISESHPDEAAAAVKMAAEYEADHTTNNILWFTAGLATSAVCVLGGCIGAELTYMVTESTFDYDYHDHPPEGHTCLGVSVPSVTEIRFLGTFSGAAACSGLSFLGIYHAKPSKPPPEKFIGKSPEYVKSYLSAYTSKARSNRIKSAVAGAVTGCGIVLFIGTQYL